MDNLSVFQTVLGAILAAIALALAVAWIFLPFLLVGRIDKLIKATHAGNQTLREIFNHLDNQAALNRFATRSCQPARTAPKPEPKQARAIMASFQCPHCAQNMVFDPAAFDAENPPRLPCPNCGEEIEISAPMRYQVTTAGDHVV